jgi:urease accessory protein UreE
VAALVELHLALEGVDVGFRHGRLQLAEDQLAVAHDDVDLDLVREAGTRACQIHVTVDYP